MAYNLLGCGQEQGYVIPASLRQWLKKGQMTRFIVDEVELRGRY